MQYKEFIDRAESFGVDIAVTFGNEEVWYGLTKNLAYTALYNEEEIIRLNRLKLENEFNLDSFKLVIIKKLSADKVKLLIPPLFETEFMQLLA